MSDHRIFRHDKAESLAPDVWRVRGGLPYPLTRNMIVLRLASGRLLLHSLVALDAEGMADLEAIGRPAYAIVPSRHHQRDAPFYRERYPDLMILCPEAERTLVEENVRVDATVEEVLPALGFRLHPVPGVKFIEYVYDAPMPEGGRMLMANDVLGSPHAGRGALGRAIFDRLLVWRDGPDIPRAFAWRHMSDPEAAADALAALGRIKDLRLVTVSHGDPVTENPGQRLLALAGKGRRQPPAA